MRKDWCECKLEDLLDYIQPTKYIVDSTKYSDQYKTPVLTPGKSFIIGYTNETDGIFSELPVIIFDDFTTATQFVNFKFKVKSSAMKILQKTSDLVNIKYAYYFMQTIRQNTDTHKRYWISIFSQLPIKLAPLPEQRAIVAKIEQLFSELDNGIANLKAVKEKLEIYRQAVLKKAFEGELTKEWRERQKDLPTAEELLEQIKLEREKFYQKQLDEWKEKVKEWEATGKEGKKPSKKQKIDLTTTDIFNFNEYCPPNWRTCQIADILNDLTDYHANGSYEKLKENVKLYDEPDFAIMIRATNFEKYDFKKDLKYINKHAYNFLSKSKLFGGEILIGKIGNAGHVYLMPILNKKASLAMNLFALRINYINSKFIYYQLLSYSQKNEIKTYICPG
ncbi:MAG: restriction endonuclease subunit S [Bacteroidales bacterium]|nr:restriction endonuclease subunit S [Bacteroidales bacterium]